MIFFHVNRYSVLNEEKENILDQYDPRSVDDRNTMDVAMFTKKLVQVPACFKSKLPVYIVR